VEAFAASVAAVAADLALAFVAAPALSKALKLTGESPQSDDKNRCDRGPLNNTLPMYS